MTTRKNIELVADFVHNGGWAIGGSGGGEMGCRVKIGCNTYGTELG